LTDPYFSVITCTYNSQKYLERNISSVNQQLFKDYEHIFIDGKSTDKTGKMIRNYQKYYPEKVKLFTRTPKGISNAFNEGIKKSRGKYLIHLNSDDSFYNNNVLQKAFDFLSKKESLDWIYGKINVLNEKEKSLGIYPNKYIFKTSSKNRFGSYILKFINYIPHQAVFIKNEIFEKYGYFDETLSSKMDPDFWLKIRKETYWKFCEMTVSNFMLREGAMTSSKDNISINKSNLDIVQNRYMNKLEYFFARILNYFINIKDSRLTEK